MSKETLSQHFESKGFGILPQVFNADEIAELRKLTTKIFDIPATHKGDRNNIRFDWLVRYPELRKAFLKKEFIDAMKDIMGDDFLFLPDAAFMDSCYGGWHRDTGSQELFGKFFHYETGFLITTVAIYLQDNDETYAGGLDIVPGSHRTRARAHSQVSRPHRPFHPALQPQIPGFRVGLRYPGRKKPPRACPAPKPGGKSSENPRCRMY